VTWLTGNIASIRHKSSSDVEGKRVMKYMLTAMVVLAAMGGGAYSQNVTQKPGDQPVHPGTAILDRMGIFAGNPAPAPRTQQASQSLTNTAPAHVSETASKQ
jgi:hypothetical protein